MALQVAGVAPVPAAALGQRDGRIVGQRLVVQVGAGHVQAEAVDPLLQPVVQHRQRRLAGRRRCASSAWAAGAGTCGGSAGAAPAGRPRPGRRTPRASCWARSRPAWDRPRRTSRPWGHPCRRSGSRRTRDGRRRCGSAPRPARPSGRGRGPRRAGPGSPRACRSRPERPRSRRCRSPSRGSAKGGSATARCRPRPGAGCSRAWRARPAGRRGRRRRCRRSCGHRRGRGSRPSTRAQRHRHFRSHLPLAAATAGAARQAKRRAWRGSIPNPLSRSSQLKPRPPPSALRVAWPRELPLPAARRGGLTLHLRPRSRP